MICRLLENCDLLVKYSMETKACGKLNLCSGLGSDIEGDAHSNLYDYSKTQFPLASDQALLYGESAREKGRRGAGKEWG